MEDDSASLAKSAEMCRETKPELIAQVEEFHRMYQSLTEQYEHLTAELSKNVPSQFQKLDAGDSDSGYNTTMLTPDQKLGFHKNGHGAVSGSSVHGSSDLSLKEGSKSSSSSLDSESDSFNSSGNAYYSLPVYTDHKRLHQKFTQLASELSMEEKLQMDAEESENNAVISEENESYEELLGRIFKFKEELRISKLKLQLSEDEVSRLKRELAKSESLVGTLEVQLESANRDIKTKGADLGKERRRVVKLQTQMSDGSFELQGQLNLAQEETTVLKAKLDLESRQALDLQERIASYENDLSDCDHEVRALKAALCDAQENFSVEKENLHSKILGLSEVHWKLRGNYLVDKLRQCETEKIEMKNFYDAQENRFHGEINQLKAELNNRLGEVEFINKNYDGLKYKYDMLMAEKDEMNAKVNTLIADVSCRDNQIRQMEEHLQRLHKEHAKLTAGSVASYENDLSDRDHEVRALKAALCDAQENFSVDKEYLHSKVVGLSDVHWELHGNSLDDKLRQCETEKIEMKDFYDAQESQLHGEINQLKAELNNRLGEVELINKSYDGLKYKYDMLMAEKDGVNAKVNTLIADVSCRNIQIRQMQEHLQRLHKEHAELIAGSVASYENDLSDHNHEVRALKAALCHARENFSVEKENLYSKVVGLSDVHWELHGNSLDDKLRQCETEKIEMKDFCDAQESQLHGEINQLKAELNNRLGEVELISKSYDGLKYKYDMLMAEKDEMNAKVNTLIADVSCRDNQIRQMQEHLQRLHKEHAELIAGSENAQTLVDELKMKVVELEKEVDKQRVEISVGAEEKREAIRQLCFSLEHYRSGYKELRLAFVGLKRHAVMAS